MHNGRPDPLLAQIPLTVSPFVSLPTAVTLPYTYKSLPSTLPQSSTGSGNGTDPSKYVVSSSGHAAGPDEIIESCRRLQRHLQQMQDDAEQTLRDWEQGIRERELAEKRRLAPGWLDRDEKILEPERMGSVGPSVPGPTTSSQASAGPATTDVSNLSRQPGSNTEGEELDRAFGAFRLQ